MCSTAIRPPLNASRKILLVMNSMENTEYSNLNTKRIDNAYTEIHRDLRRQMFKQAGGSSYGNPQQLTMADYAISFVCMHDKTPIVQFMDMKMPERIGGEVQALNSR